MRKHSVKIAGHPTSITLEDEFWIALQSIAKTRGQTINDLVTEIDEGRGEHNLSSALRVFVLKTVQDHIG
jgi:predicted DNA-binding ribbon-helix-helix protein